MPVCNIIIVCYQEYYSKIYFCIASSQNTTLTPVEIATTVAASSTTTTTTTTEIPTTSSKLTTLSGTGLFCLRNNSSYNAYVVVSLSCSHDWWFQYKDFFGIAMILLWNIKSICISWKIIVIFKWRCHTTCDRCIVSCAVLPNGVYSHALLFMGSSRKPFSYIN